MNKKIAFFHEQFPMGGAERVTYDLIKFLIKNGYNIYLFVRELNKEKITDINFFNNSVNTLILPDSDKTDTNNNTKYIIEKIKELDINVLIIQVYLKLDILKIKEHNPLTKIIYCNHGVPFWEIENKIELKKRESKTSLKARILYYLINKYRIEIFHVYHKRFRKKYMKLYNEVDAYVTLCEGYSNQISQTLKLKDTSKLFAINNFENPVHDVIMDKQKVVLFVGRLTYADKRADRILNIWNLLGEKTNGWKLIIVGDGPEKENLERQAINLGFKNVEFTGFCLKPKKYYDIASILCMTSTFEGWGLVLTEAQANGVIPMAFGCSAGVKDILNPSGENGYIITPFDLKEYANKILSIMNNEEERKRLQKNVLKKSKLYSPEVVGKKWIDLIEYVLSN